MIGPAFYLTTRSLKNRVVRTVTRMKNPRYLASSVVAFFYFSWMLLRRSGIQKFGQAQQFNELVFALSTVALFFVLLIPWASPSQSGGVELSEAELYLLLPAPITRLKLLLYKFFRSQPQLLFSTTVMTLLGYRRGFFIGVWLAMSTISLYMMMVAQARARLKQLHIGFVVRFISVVAITLGAVGYVAWASRLKHGPHQIDGFVALLNRAPLSILLFIPRCMAMSAYPHDARAFLFGAPILVVLGALSLVLAARMRVSFEEGTVAATQRKLERTERLTQRGSGRNVTFKRLPPPFKLGARGPIEVAIVWKNLIAAMRISAIWIVILVLVAIVFVGQAVFTTHDSVRVSVSTAALILTGLFPLFGSALFAQDMRLDLPRLELLKSYPIAGDRLVAAEIAAPLVIVSSIELLLLSATGIILSLKGSTSWQALDLTQYLVVALLFAIPICALQLLIRNAVPLIVPAWSTRSKEEVRGFAVTGQRLILMAMNLLALGILLIPAAILFLPGVWLSMHFGGGPIGLALATGPAVAVMVVEIYIGLRLLGGRFDDMDVTADLDLVAT